MTRKQRSTIIVFTPNRRAAVTRCPPMGITVQRTEHLYVTCGNIQKVSVVGVGDHITNTYGNNDWQDLLTQIKIGSTPINIAYEGQAYVVSANTVSDDPIISGNSSTGDGSLCWINMAK